MKIAVVTSFPKNYWEMCAKNMVESFCKFWPKDVSLFLFTEEVMPELQHIDPERANIFINPTRRPDHLEFIKRNAGRDDLMDYRKQSVRFSHKPAALIDTLEFMENNPEFKTDYLIWLDADTFTKAPVTEEWLKAVLPSEGQICSYLGRKDWPHSECGWLGFRNCTETKKFMEDMWSYYTSDKVFEQQQWDDSWLFDLERKNSNPTVFKNLSEGVPGNHVWPHTKLAECLEHLKGPVLKSQQVQGKPVQQMNGISINNGGQMVPLTVQTVNAIDEKHILQNISDNRKIISNWVKMCKENDETVIVVSGGTSLDVEEVRKFYDQGHKVVAVKNAVKRLVEADIIPWAVILLDPRGHVADFIDFIPKETFVLVASQCDPTVPMELCLRGYKVIGYHAPVNAPHTWEHGDFLINGGSATATRGLFVLYALGFRNFELFGYDLCYFRKPNLEEKNEQGSAKYLEVEISTGYPQDNDTRGWWSEGQFIAQVQEVRQILQMNLFKVNVHGEGIVAWLNRSRNRSDLKERRMRDKLPEIQEFLDGMAWTKK